METIQIEIKSNAPQVEKETTSLRQQVRELRKEMESCAVGSKEYNDALAKLATTTHDFKDQQEAIRNSAGDLGTALSNVQGVATGIVSGFSAVNAVMTLTGSNTEDLQKAMVSLQAGIALVQGMAGLEGLPKTINATVTSLKSLFTATTKETAATGALATSQGFLATVTKGVSNAFKGLKAALLSSGIGGILVLVGALAAGMTALVGVIRNNLQAENEFKDANEQLNQSFEAQNHALDNEIKLMKASGASQEEIIKEKQKLTAAQIKETEATLENARARLQQLKNDSAWTRFRKGENKVIKELEEKTIPELEATLEKLNTKATDLTYEYKEAEINTQNELKKNREQAANNAIQTAKRVAEERKKFLEDVENTAEDSFKKILEEYKGLIGNIKTARESILSTNTVSQAISDIQAFGLVYGTDFNKFDKQLQGVQSALVSNAIAAAAKERDRQLAEKFGDKEAEEKIKSEYAQFLNDLYNMIDNVSSDVDPIQIEAEDAFETFRKSISDKAKGISDIQAFGLVYGTDFNKLDKQLQSVQNTLISDAIAAAAEERDRQLAEKFGDKEAEEKIKSEYENFVKDIYKIINSTPPATENIDEISNKAKAISEEFTNRFNALNSLYKDGVMSYEEYFDTLKKVQNDYLEATNKFEEEYVSKVTEGEERVAELRCQYAIKPLKFQKEASEKFLQELYGQIAEKFGDTEAENKIKAEYAQLLYDLYDMINSASSDVEPIHIDIAPALIEAEDEVATFSKSISDKAKAISEEFTNRFNALNSLYKDGVITYEEYFDTLQKVQNDYLEATDNFEEEYVSKVSGCEQRVAELRYQYALNPLEFQKEVGEKFLQELDRQLAAIENKYFKSSVLLERDVIKWQGTINTASGQWSTSLKDRYNTELSILNAQRDIETKYYSKEKGRLVEELNNNMLTVEQRAGLWAQIEQLDADHLVNQADFNAKEKALNDEWKASLVSTGIEGLNAFESLTSSLNAVSKAQLDEYKRQYEAGEISKEKFEKLQDEELHKQASLQKATAIMQTAAGIATVWAQASKLGVIAGPIIAAIQTAAYIANLNAQLKSIDTALQAGTAGDTSGGSASAPDTSFTLTSPDAYQNTLSDEVQTDLQANAQSNQRVYVLESDITSKQDNVKSAVTTSTF